jgi:hypothetical protein
MGRWCRLSTGLLFLNMEQSVDEFDIFLFKEKFYSSPIANEFLPKHTAKKRNRCEKTSDPPVGTITSPLTTS